MKKQKIALLLLLIVFGISGCTAANVRNENAQQADNHEEKQHQLPALPPDDPSEPKEEPHDEEDILRYRPNELGQVMILMYHEIGGEEATWRRTVENFRSDLETLYREGYRPVSLQDYIKGNFDVPAGKTPFILTFDDATAGHFRYIEKDGKQIPDPDCAVAILLEMGEKYDDFDPAGTFFVYYPLPFRQQEWIAEKLNKLDQWGFEIGNHAYNHENLGKLSPDDAVKALARHVESTQKYLPGYEVKSLALPYGARPKDFSHLVSGKYNGISYQNDAILLVGANPAPSPYAQNFNPHSLPRVRADGTELYRWLDFFANNPHKRFISDGKSDLITIPAPLMEELHDGLLEDNKIFFYDPDED